MAKINDMAMSADIAKSKLVYSRKAFFGLSTNWFYAPTGSRLMGARREYSPADGQLLEQALNAPSDKVLARLGCLGQLAQTTIGNYQLEVVRSADCRLAAFRLYQYQQLAYRPVSPLCMFEGSDAEVACRLI